jgi:ribosomal protein L31E
MPRMNQYRLTLIKEFIKRHFSQKLVTKIKTKVEEFLSSL